MILFVYNTNRKEQKMIKNFIWDFDGTIFDSYPHITEAMCTMFDNNKIKYDKQEVMDALKISFGYAYKKYEITDEQKKEFSKLEGDMSFKPLIVPYPETIRILKLIKQRGYKNFIYTHRGEKSLLQCLDKYEITELFDEIVSKRNGFSLKPSPEGITYLMNKHNLNPQETLMIGDRQIDVISGVNAGCAGCFIENGNSSEDIQADYIFSDLIELESTLLKILL